MAISKVDFFGKTLVDLTSDTVDAQTLKAGYTAHGADGTEAHPYAFAPGVACIPNAYYTAPTKYVYMPADAEKHAYDSWADAAADMVEWGE